MVNRHCYNKYNKYSKALSRYVGTFLVALAVIGLVLPPPQLCACNCCSSHDDQNEPEEDSDSQESCCCHAKRSHGERSLTLPAPTKVKNEKKSCCSDACRCSQTDENGQPYPCCCVQPMGKEVFLPEKSLQKNDLNSAFVPLVAHVLLIERGESFLKHSAKPLAPLRLHLLLCVLLN